MKSEKGIRSRRNNLLIVGCAILLAAVFAGFSIYNVNLANEKVLLMRERPFTVISAVYRVRNNLKESQAWIGRLSDPGGALNREALQRQLRALDAANAADMELFESRYLGPRADAQALRESVRRLAEAREEVFREVTPGQDERLEGALRERLAPLYLRTEHALDTIIAFSQIKSESLWQESARLNSSNIVMMVFLSLLTIGAAIAFHRTFLRRVEEVSYRDYLFGILAENVENVFLIYHRASGRMEYVSPNVERVFGIEPAELREKAAIFSYCEETDPKLRRAFEAEEISARLETECRLRNPRTGRLSWVNFSVFPTRDGASVERYVLCLTDLSEAKRAQQALRDAMLDAQNANKAKSGFLSRVSHEIRTPMNVIIGMATIAASSIGNTARVEDCLAKIGTASRHLLLLINDVLDMSKIENGKLNIVKEPFLLSDVVAEINSIVYPQIKARNQKFKISMLDIEHETLLGDALRLNQVLLNILSNAVKFTPSGGRIEMQIREMAHRHHHTARFRFTISDTGIGIKREFLDRLFAPFEQDATNPQRRGGTGLGMAITKNIVSLMGGVIRVESEEGRGSTFVVELSFTPEQREAQKQKQRFDDLKVLLADDEPDCCEHAMVLLRRLGVAADWVLSGQAAVEKTAAAHQSGDGYDVLFLDWKMPELDGIETARQVRECVGPETLIIILTAYDWSEIEAEAKAAGINGFIAKPLFQSTLYQTLLGVSSPREVKDSSAADNAFAGKHLLVVEDNEINMEIALELLKNTGAVCHTAWNGAEAVTQFADSPEGFYDAILMDIQMPILDGNAAARRIRALPRADAKRVAIVAMTAHAFKEEIMASFEAGMDAHVAKPIDRAVLIKSVAQAMGEAARRAAL